jgi:hypothetical protein
LREGDEAERDFYPNGIRIYLKKHPSSTFVKI